ncbi:MAG: GMC family oxidoreductase [Acidobacteria bacterium]|nr:GMC family oxidoreductase [Acidobacteriota bacterium]
MLTLKKVDVVIAGGGWTGLATAKEITTRTALEVVVLERGAARSVSEYSANMDEVDYSIRMRMLQNIAEETLTHRHTIRDTAAPVRQWGHARIGTGTGGGGEHWAGVANRYPADTFVLATALRERFGTAKLPEHLSVQDWAFTWNDIEPYYTRVEEMMGIGGKAGNIQGRKIEGGNIFEGPRSKEYPVGPHRKTGGMAQFETAARQLGYHPYNRPAATLPFDYKNPDGIQRPACAYCGYCAMYGCMIGSKAQPTNLLMPILRRRKSFTLRNGCWVRRIKHQNGRAEGVVYMDSQGQEVFQPADLVVAGAFTPNNVRLLLMSKIGVPYDPLTGQGTLGKNFTHQLSGGADLQLIHKQPMGEGMRAGGQGMSVSDFDGFNGIENETGILRGGTFTGGGGGSGLPIASFGAMPAGAAPRNWGSQWKKATLEYHDRIAGAPTFEAEHLAYKHNYLDLDPTYTDKWGDPLLRTTIDWTEHEQRVRAFAARVSAKMAREMAAVSGAKVIEGGGRGAGRRTGRYQTSAYATSHLHGGAIMGDSPANSVVNSYLQHWHLSNLWVVGASAFPQAGATNPTITSLSITLRACDALINRYLKHPGALA